MNRPLKLFITYSHKDKKQKKELKHRLAVLEQENKITIWHDNEITPGDKWRDKISDNLADSNILLYLVSAYSLASENCNKELIEALQTKSIRTIPIILEACDWEKRQISEFQALPTDGRPINEWKPESKAWQDVVDGIRKTVEKTLSQMETTPTQNAQEELQALVAFQNGNFFAMLEQMELAIDSYSQAIKIKPNAEAYSNTGNAKNNLGRYKDAIEDFDKAIEINPNYIIAHINRGTANFNLKQYKDAIKDFDKAIEINPNYAIAYNYKGIANLELGQYKDTIKDFDEAIETNPNFATTYYNKGIAYLCLSKWEDAKADLTTAKNKGADIVALFQDEFKSVSDFEKKYNVKLPDNIKALFE